MIGAWWYICFAQIVVLLIPVIVEAGKKLGIILLPFSFVLAQYLPDGISSPYGGRYKIYFMVIIMGSLCAEYDIFKYFTLPNTHKLLKFIDIFLYIITAILLLYVNEKYLKSHETMIGTVLIAFAVFFMCVWCHKYFTMPILSKVFIILGKYSGTMFMTHAFIYTYFAKYVYWSHNVIITWLELIVISFTIAVGIETLRKKFP